MVWQIAVATIVTILILAVEHYWPWQLLLGRKLKRLEAYVGGILAILLPLVSLFIVWKSWNELIALLSVILSGGFITFGLYALDGWIVVRGRADAAEKAERRLRDGSIID